MALTDLEATYPGHRVVVFGASGFIGAHVVRELVRSGAEVFAVARTKRGTIPQGATQIAADLRVEGEARAVVESIRPAITFNLAAYGVNPTERDPDTAERINHSAVTELAGACAAGPTPGWHGLQMVHVGSALEYGTASGNLDEATTPSPTTVYGLSKLAGTRAVESAVRDRGLRATTARLFTVYGAGEAAGRLLPSLIAHARQGAPIALTTGHQLRDFTFVGDVVEGLLRLGAASASPPVVNVATGSLESVRRFAERAADVLGFPRELLRFGEVETRPEEMRHDPVSVARLHAAVGWTPTTSIENGVMATLVAANEA